MISAFLITLREGLEMSLIVGILLAYLARTGRRRDFPAIWTGVAFAALASLVAAAVIFVTAGAFTGRGEQVFEGAAFLTAVGVLTYMIFWMRREAVTLRASLQARMSEALRAHSRTALVVLAAVAVGREGIETALFFFATVRASSPLAGGAGAVLGLGAAVLLGWLLYRGTYRLDLRMFFNVTSALLLVVGAGLLTRGIGELQEARLVPVLVEQLWNSNRFVSQTSTLGNLLEAMFGYTSTPSLMQVAAYAVYLAAVGWAYFRPVRLPVRPRPAEGPSTTVEPAAQPRERRA
ncbi:MAG TPA: iron uptake transporter permease EfeU [bacterium]|nr:iron uptake transporter permease EfeU [bacterium]